MEEFESEVHQMFSFQHGEEEVILVAAWSRHASFLPGERVSVEGGLLI